jgi:pyruvate,water dikinase
MSSDEVKELIENNEKSTEFTNKITRRKIEMVKYRDLQLPEIIYDDFLPAPIDKVHITNELEGVPTSKGYYVGPIKIVRGINDINKIHDGDIIAIPYSDVSWTPLFTKAKAVISESGGVLSHSSIVAREYNIPAIVSVNNATVLSDNTLIAVDAYRGKISILKHSYNEDKEPT